MWKTLPSYVKNEIDITLSCLYNLGSLAGENLLFVRWRIYLAFLETGRFFFISALMISRRIYRTKVFLKLPFSGAAENYQARKKAVKDKPLRGCLAAILDSLFPYAFSFFPPPESEPFKGGLRGNFFFWEISRPPKGGDFFKVPLFFWGKFFLFFC